MQKILFIQTPHYFDGKSRQPEYFPLGIGHLVAELEPLGYEIDVMDIWGHQWTHEEVLARLDKLPRYDAIGISAMSTQYPYVKWLARELKRRQDTPLILGGILPTFSAPVVLQNTLIDFCVISEGEVTLPDLLRNLGSPEKVKGIVYRRNEAVVGTEPREPIRRLDTLKFANRDVFPVNVYLKYGTLDGNEPGLMGMKAINIDTNRGCPWDCKFCSKTFESVRYRSPKNVREEIELCMEKYGIQAVYFVDELLVVKKSRMYEICQELKPLKIKWQGQARVDTVDLDLLKCMKDAGCVQVGLGIESGSQQILDNMRKRSTVKQNLDAIEMCKNVGFDIVLQCIYGYEGENDETIAETVKFFKQADVMHEGFFVLTPLPGTELYDNCLRTGVIKDEDEYLSRLEAGYNTTREALVNLTEFTFEEFVGKKAKMEKQIEWNYLKRHPFKRVTVRTAGNNLVKIPFLFAMLGPKWYRWILSADRLGMRESQVAEAKPC